MSMENMKIPHELRLISLSVTNDFFFLHRTSAKPAQILRISALKKGNSDFVHLVVQRVSSMVKIKPWTPVMTVEDFKVCKYAQ